MWELTCNEEGQHTLARYCYVKVKYMYMYMEIPIVTHTESYHDGQVQCRGETMTITFHTGRYSGSLDSELEHDDYELKLTRTIVTITVTEKLCEYTRGR